MRDEELTGGATNPSCRTGKLAYVARREAKAHARRLKRTATHDGHGLRPYRCPSCGLWHVGHLPPEVRVGLWSADEHYLDRIPWRRA